MTANCLSCSQNKSIEEFCKDPKNHSIPGCETFGKKYTCFVLEEGLFFPQKNQKMPGICSNRK